MSDHESLRAELARVTEERDALLAERERTAPLVAAATEYAAACEAAREAREAWQRSVGPNVVREACAAAAAASDKKHAAGAKLAAAAAAHADGGSR